MEGNGEINASSSSSSISSGNVIFFERDSKQGFISGGVKKRVRFGSDRVGSGRVGSGRVGSGRVGSGRNRSKPPSFSLYRHSFTFR